MYLHTKNNFLGQCFQKLEPEQDITHTDRRDWKYYHATFTGSKRWGKTKYCRNSYDVFCQKNQTLTYRIELFVFLVKNDSILHGHSDNISCRYVAMHPIQASRRKHRNVPALSHLFVRCQALHLFSARCPWQRCDVCGGLLFENDTFDDGRRMFGTVSNP